MKTTRTLVVAIVLVTAGLVVGGAQLASGSVVASVQITSPEGGSTVMSDVNVQAQAYGQAPDQPKKIQFFVDKHKHPAATVDCLVNLADMNSYCGGAWVWHASQAGSHSLSAKVILLDGQISDRSERVKVFVTAQTQVTVHHAKHPVAGHKMAIAGRVRSLSQGRPGAAHLPVTVTTSPAYGRARTLHLRTNRHGYYRKKIRAVSNMTIIVAPGSTRKYVESTEVSYQQYVRGRPRCRLSRHHAKVKHPVILNCRLRHLPYGSKFVIQNRIHGRWRRGRAFTTTKDNHSKLYVSGLKRTTLVMREIFPTSAVYSRSPSNTVRLHVT